jgi:dTDP-glucose pyrophosphorylase
MDWKKTIIGEKSNISDAAKNLNSNGVKICLVVNRKNQLVGTITDGDIRRGFLKGCKLSDKIEKIINKKFVSIKKGSNLKSAYKIMKNLNINYLPVLEDKKLVNLYFYENNFFSNNKIHNDFIIMAGGFGKRLYPITKNIPKPMVKVKNKPILEHIILNARNEGFYKFTIIIHHLKDKIINYFKDGSKFGVNIEYIVEKKPLGTAGGLALLKKKISKNILITNADMLSSLSFKDLLNYHTTNKSDATVGVKVMSTKENYGLVDLKGINIVKFKEKPTVHRFINCGVYALNTQNLKKLAINKQTDMISFLEKLKNDQKKIIAFPVYEGWLDLGNRKNLKKFLR